MKRAMTRRSWVLVLASMVVSAPALAQSDNRVAAEALFRDARKLLDAGQYAEACQKLASSEQLDPAVGTLLNLARCYEKLGKTATAWSTYRDAAAAARRAGQEAREKSALRAAEALEATLPHLTIEVGSQAREAKAQIDRDGVAVTGDLWGVSVPVDPGEHVVTARAEGKKTWSSTAHLAARESQVVRVPPLEGSTPAPAPPAEAAPSPVVVAPEASAEHPSPAPRSSSTGQRVAAGAAIGVGVAGVVVAVLEGIAFHRDTDQASQECAAAGCSHPSFVAANALLDDARHDQTVGIIAGSVGGAALVAGAVLWLTSGRGEAGTIAVVPVGSSRHAGVAVEGRF
jgi:hypothetical protein